MVDKLKILRKLFSLIWSYNYFRSLKYAVAAGIEHKNILQSLNCQTVVDIGANKGQFSLVARQSFPEAKIIAFEPLAQPSEKFNKVFSKDKNIKFHNVAIGPKHEKTTIHISQSEDSSSLLPISKLQDQIFPGTKEVSTAIIEVAPLNHFVTENDIHSHALLKLDVQGFEIEALQGCESLLNLFDYVYCECSFVELYTGQKLACDVIDWLSTRGYKIKGMYNTSYDNNGLSIQADFLFVKT